MGAEPKGHKIERSWRGQNGVAHAEVMRTRSYGKAAKSG